MKKKLLATMCAVVGMSLVGAAWAQNVSKTVTTNAIKIEDAYTRATVPGQQVAGGFMKIENKGAADQLISASSPVAGEVQIHEMAMEGNVMKMRQVKDIAVPAGGAVELKPGGLHLMFLNIKAPLAAGETIPVKLRFAKAGDVEVKMPVNAMGAGAMKH
ncbi:copper chaperone PCu(A)C [Polynucleobacter sp. AP-Reno-20A-A9]|uniref:copper chaperone PCu(A)C n=1 Tax=Polynucleobacter sp. AP-Reno-20A-A9 TaxID=2576925 RepID=UPI001C0D8CF5|nr:copper chaperone PCu(A)C [Polynucleobacter sp. AP-Reno-20A-A9]MBU3628632.1 copper chaperone PCu(A)C [Polynucleobacter sp. AP-Reno-20A-A9]